MKWIKTNVQSYEGQMWVNCKGSCLDSPQSPQRVKDGDIILMHPLPITDMNILVCANRLIGFKLNGIFYVKYLSFVDIAMRYTITIEQFNPIRKVVIPINQLEALYLVDDIKSLNEIEFA